MKVEHFKSMRLVPKNPVVAAVVLVVVRVADEDFLVGGRGAEDVDATSASRSYPDGGIDLYRSKTLSVKVVAAINGMKKSGHEAHLYKLHGKVWVEIDRCMLASFDEIEQLVDRVHSFEELEEIFRKRHVEQLGGI